MDKLQRLSYSVAEVSEMTGLGVTKIYEELKNGILRGKKFGRRTTIQHDCLMEYLNNLPAYPTESSMTDRVKTS